MSTTTQPGKMPELTDEEKEEEITHLVEVITDPKTSKPIQSVIENLAKVWKGPEDPTAKLQALLEKSREKNTGEL